MALSFEESKKQLLQTSTTASPTMFSARTMSVANEWTRVTSPEYAWFDDFRDDKLSYVDENKDINIDSSQVNISQESKSQFIPFEMPRYYDGIDLTKMAISIHFTNSDKQHAAVSAVNVEYNNDRIRFAWLVDANATHVDGNLNFEIHADGAISDSSGKSYEYRWKSKPTNKFNIVKSLCQDPNCEPIVVSDDWVQEIVQNVATAVANEIKNVQVDLSNYYTRDEVDNKVNNVKVDLTGYATENYVDQAVAKVDVSEQLKDYAKITDIPDVSGFITEVPDEYVTEDELSAKGYLTEHQSLDGYARTDDIPDVSGFALKSDIPDVSNFITEIPAEYVTESELDARGYLTEHQSLENYALKSELPSTEGLATEEFVREAISNVEVDLSDYYTKSEVDLKDAALSSSIDTNTSNISSLSNIVTELQESISGIDTSARKTYDVVYNDPGVGENVFVLYEIENEGLESEVREEKKKFTIVGGSGGSSTSSSLKIEYVTKTPVVATMSDDVVIKYNFSGTDSSGDAVMEGAATWKVGSRVVATNTAIAGENSFDITQHLSLGTQKVVLSITDEAGSLVTKTWTVQKVDVRIESTFNDRLACPMGSVSFDYTPYGAIAKDVHFKLDGVEIGVVNTQVSGIPMSYTIPVQTHGAHLFEVYMTAEINGNIIESNHIYKDIIWYDSNSNLPVIGCIQQDFVALQYDTTNIVYTVYDPSTETPNVILAIDGEVISRLTISQNTQTWQYKSSDVGPHVLTITCGETVKTLNVVVEKLNIDVEPVTGGLVFDFNPSGKSNGDADRLWSDGEITMTVSDNFDWVNGGYQIDSNGDQYFCVKSGTRAVINYNLFSDDPKKNGKEFKVIFKTTNIKNRNTSFISCMDNNIGLDMKVESANIYSSNNNLYSPYCEEDVIEFEFNINKNTDIPMVLTYEDGVANRPMIYTADASFMQSVPQPITIGSDDCDVYIYRMKAYATSLNDRGILSNFIADARNAEEMIARYNRNQIYDENGLLTPEVLAERCPDLRIIMVDAPWFTNDKKNKVEDTNITMIYKNGDPILDNWTCTGAQHSGRTSTCPLYMETCT